MTRIAVEKSFPSIWEARAEGYDAVGIGFDRNEAINDLRKQLGKDVVPFNHTNEDYNDTVLIGC